ncbi:hypothetical protein NXH76_13850 [Blautia schinkii]|nr:hypothetical protein [Blautia schinkii]
MNKTKCQICDGPIVNGRCKLCGMPYRNDEVLYHLNENRSDHLRHATPEARRELKESEIPLGDKAKKILTASMEAGKKINTPKHTPATPSTLKRTAAKPPTPPTTSRYYTKPSNPPAKGEKKRNITAIIITIIVIICTLLPAGIDFAKEHFAYELSAIFKNKDLDGYTVYGFLSKQDGEVTAGQWIPAGRYIAVIDEGYCSIEIQHEDSFETVYLTGDKQLSVDLQTGDTFSLHNVDTEDREVKLYLIKEYTK